MLPRMMSYAEGVVDAVSPAEASRRFFANAKRMGATYLQTRLYRRPADRLTPKSHWQAGGFVARFSKPSWPESPGFRYVCFQNNPLLTPIREGRTRYRFSDFAPHGRKEFGPYWDALSEADIGDALCSTSYGPERLIASLHLGFETPKLPAKEAAAAQLAGLVLTERLMSLAEPEELPAKPVQLSPRELDSLAFVAEGKTDWEISVILGVSEATARFHVDNARKKLGAVSRAQAVARMIHRRLI